MAAAYNLINQYSEEIAKKRAEWIDSVLISNLPSWKVTILRKFPFRIVAFFLNVHVEIEEKQLIANFGTQTYLYLNGRCIGMHKFKIN